MGLSVNYTTFIWKWSDSELLNFSTTMECLVAQSL